MNIDLVPDHRSNLRVETAISVVFNTIISGVFAWGIFHGTAVIPRWGAKGIVVDLIPTVFMITLVMTIVLTLITRGRVKKGKLPAPTWGKSDLRINGWLPRNVVLRAVLQAATATLILVPLSALILVAAGVESMGFTVFFIFKLFYGAIIAVLITPLIILRALADTS